MKNKFDRKTIIFASSLLLSTVIIFIILAVFYFKAVDIKELELKREFFKIVTADLLEVETEKEDNSEKYFVEMTVESLDDLVKSHNSGNLVLYLFKEENAKEEPQIVGIEKIEPVANQTKTNEKLKKEVFLYKIVTQPFDENTYKFIKIKYS